MRIFCDEHVPPKYVFALELHADQTVTTVTDELYSGAPDAELSAFATSNDWVLLTNDSDFRGDHLDHGLLIYDQLNDPRPGEIIDAVCAIDQAYANHEDIYEFIPGGWV